MLFLIEQKKYKLFNTFYCVIDSQFGIMLLDSLVNNLNNSIYGIDQGAVKVKQHMSDHSLVCRSGSVCVSHIQNNRNTEKAKYSFDSCFFGFLS